MNGLIDFHTHILPEMDDGAKDTDESLEIIAMLKEQGVSTIVSTSHYYMQDEDIDAFLNRRNTAFEKLKIHAEKKNFELPRIILGAEVLFSPLLCDCDCRPLCIGNTSYILLEMPYTKFSQSHFKSLENFLNMSGLDCILAHVERYFHFNDEKDVYKLAMHDVLCQINAGSLIDKKYRRRTLKLISKGYGHLIGTDTHNTETRKPNLDGAVKVLSKKKYAGIIDDMTDTAKEILKI